MSTKKAVKRDIMSALKPVLVLLALLLAVGLFVKALISQEVRIQQYRSETKELEQAIAQEESRLEQVEAEQEKVNTDEYIEGVARDKLGLVKPDEQVFIDVSGN